MPHIAVSTPTDIMTTIPISAEQFEARAILLGERIDLRALENTDVLDTAPLTIALRNGGIAVLARFGAIVLFDVAPLDEAGLLDYLRPLVLNPYPVPETEKVEIRVDANAREGMRGNTILLRDAALEKLQVIADILSKSVVLGLYESRVAKEFDRIEPLASELEQSGQVRAKAKDLVRHIGSMLISEHRMVGRASVNDKPELLWDFPQLEGLYVKLEDEFQIRERHEALERKLKLLSHTSTTFLELVHNRHSLRVEWYIVALIVVEIVLTVLGKYH